MQHFTALTRCVLVALTAACLAMPAAAQIYKYQDERGKWHFTDRPPAKAKDAQVVSQGAAPRASAAGEDLQRRLMEKFEPQSPAETATLAVVTVKTPIGNGSGFFVSSDGFLLTNRHVVRPQETGQWQNTSRQLDDALDRFQEADSALDQRAALLADMRGAREELGRQIAQAGNGVRRAELSAEHDRLGREYQARNREYQAVKKDLQAQRRKLDRSRSEFNRRGAATTGSTNFKIILKDQTQLRARLVGLSEHSDLALLKVDGYVTPKLDLAGPGEVSQGMPVFAVGSPLGLADAMTAGVVTRVRGDHIMTDAKILPGNSGGPLITEHGKVIGINTLKLARRADGDGFGLAIPAAVAGEQFPQLYAR